MRIKILTLLLTSLTLASCASNDEEISSVVTPINNDLMPNKILSVVVGYSDSEPYIGYLPHNQVFTYDSYGRVTKMEKDYFSFKYEKYIDLKYEGNKVTLETKSSNPSLIVAKNTIIYTLNNGKVVEKLIPATGPFIEAEKKYLYEYNTEGKLYKIILKYPNYSYLPEIGDFEMVDVLYYEGNNLKKIVSKSLNNYNSNSNERYETEFSNYDTARNPFKRLGMLEFYFHRSLSENNYREKSYHYYDENNIKSLISSEKLTFNYDQNNDIKLTVD